MFSSLISLALVSLALPTATLASSHGPAAHRRHEAIAHAVADNATEHTLVARGTTYTNARLTYYAVGLGACGQYNVPSDYIVALNSHMYGSGYPGPNCFRPISITYNGKTVSATIMDECPGCPADGGLDLSEGLFAALAPLDDGVLYASWHFTDEGGNDDPTTTSTKHSTKHSTTTSWTPTTTWEPSTTWEPTTSWTPTTTSHSTHSTTSTTSSSSSSSSSSETPTSTSTSSSSSSTSHSSSTHTSSTAAATPTASGLASINQAFVGLMDFMVVGGEAA